MGKIFHYFFLISSFLFFAKPAYANIGVPMIFITLPYMVIGLIPIIIIEAYVLTKKLGISLKQSVKSSAIVNAVSTLIGIPLTWLFLVLIQMVTGGGAAHGLQSPAQKFLAITWQAPWLIPYESDLNWMIPSSTLVLLIPFFFASWMIEYKIAKRILKQIDITMVKKGFFVANLASYSILYVLTIIWLITAMVKRSAS